MTWHWPGLWSRSTLEEIVEQGFLEQAPRGSWLWSPALGLGQLWLLVFLQLPQLHEPSQLGPPASHGQACQEKMVRNYFIKSSHNARQAHHSRFALYVTFSGIIRYAEAGTFHIQWQLRVPNVRLRSSICMQPYITDASSESLHALTNEVLSLRELRPPAE